MLIGKNFLCVLPCYMQTIINLILNSLHPTGEHTRISLNTKNIFVDITATDLTKVLMDLDTYYLSIIVSTVLCQASAHGHCQRRWDMVDRKTTRIIQKGGMVLLL